MPAAAEMHVQPQEVKILGATMTPSTVEIISIWPQSMHHSARYVGMVDFLLPKPEVGKITVVRMNAQRLSSHNPDPSEPSYFIETRPCAPGSEYSVLACVDTFEFLRSAETGEITPQPVTARVIADSRVRAWGSSPVRDARGSQGIKIRESRDAAGLAAEIAEMRASQLLLFQDAAIEGDKFASDPKTRDRVSDYHRMCVRALIDLGIPASRPWCEDMSFVETKSCPLCGTTMKSSNLICLGLDGNSGCRTQLADAYRMTNSEPDAAVKAMLARGAASAAAAPPPKPPQALKQ